MRIDSQSVLAVAIIIYGLFLAVSSANLYHAGYLRSDKAFDVQATAIYVVALALLYLVYHGVYDMSKTIGSYEDADVAKAGLWAAGIFVFLFFLYSFRGVMPFSATYAQTIISMIAVFPIFVALAENMGLIGVLGDYLYDKTHDALVASLVVGIVAVVLHASLPLALPGFSLIITFIQFALWTYASIDSHSTMPADIVHVMNNTLALIRFTP